MPEGLSAAYAATYSLVPLSLPNLSATGSADSETAAPEAVAPAGGLKRSNSSPLLALPVIAECDPFCSAAPLCSEKQDVDCTSLYL